MNTKLIHVWEAYERDGSGCALFLYKEDAENCEVFENGIDIVRLSLVNVSESDIEKLNAREPVFV